MARLTPRGGVALAVALLAGACAEQRFRLGFEPDTSTPTVQITVADTVDVQNGLGFKVDASDNLGLKTITVDFAGLLPAQAQTFTSAQTTFTWNVAVPQTQTATLGGAVLITATAVDGAGNVAVDTATVIALNPKALIVQLIRPTAGAITAPGKQIPVEVKASQQDGLVFVGWRTIPGAAAVIDADTLFTPGLPDTVDMQDTLDVPATITAGTFSIVGFAKDQSGRIVTTNPVVITVQLVIADTTGPLVTFTVAQRAEALDTIAVRARDPSGISLVAWQALDSAGTQISGQSTTLGGTLTDVTVRNSLRIPTGYTGLVVIKAWATDAAGNTDSARVDTLNAASAVLADSITVVNGLTKALPAGGRVADAVYNPNRNELYLSNVALDRLEVFRLTDTTFGAAIPVGSKPWGLALWPRDTVTGANADTVIVANSGGTDFSIVNVALGQQIRRHPLPSYGVQTIKSQSNSAGGIDLIITEYHFDDRPQYLGALCRMGNCTDSVVVVYSTTPTPGQSDPFPRRGSLRWEKVSGAVDATTGCPVTPEDHFFWEQAGVQGKSGTAVTDTLRVLTRRCGTTRELLNFFVGQIVTIGELGFLDTTYVRNSGNFTRVLVGEGGSGSPPLVFARALTYDGSDGIVPFATRDSTPLDGILNPVAVPLYLDQGVSPSLDVRNQITNTSTKVHAVGVNFNGLTNLIRADSVYVLDRDLRLRGLMVAGGPNFGMDLNFIHDFNPNTGISPSGLTNADRIAFVASPDPQIDVYDTYYFGKIASIPIRDPVIGPLRVAKLAGGQQMLVGVTINGVVTVQLPAVTNTFPASRWGPPLP